jgi:hypothetical protein
MHMKRADTPSLCTTQACTEYAKSVVSNFAPNYTAIDPCEDISEYVCGGFKQTHDYRPEQTSVSVRSAMSDLVRNIIQEILEGSYSDNFTLSGTNKTIRKENFEKMKTAYSTCMDEESIKKAGTAPLRGLLDEFDTHYPITASNLSINTSKDELSNVLVWLSKNSVSVLVSPIIKCYDYKHTDSVSRSKPLQEPTLRIPTLIRSSSVLARLGFPPRNTIIRQQFLPIIPKRLLKC